MRDDLATKNGEMGAYTGIFGRFGWYHVENGFRDYIMDTVLLIDIIDYDGKNVTDHLWFNLTEGFANLYLSRGDVVSFHARVETYSQKQFVEFTEEELKENEKEL